MKILAIDSSGLTASAALVTEEAVLAEFSTNFKKTHSQTLLPMIDSIMSLTETPAADLDAVAVAKGPGSFTGLRIGVATAKGIALAENLPLIGISSLEGQAYAFYGTEDLLCPMMDARRQQVYSGIYRFEKERLVNVLPDNARSVEEMAEVLNELGQPVILSGDGMIPAAEYLRNHLRVPFTEAKPFQNRQRAAVLGTLALQYAAEGRFEDADHFAPVYLRPSQAERVRKEREAGK